MAATVRACVLPLFSSYACACVLQLVWRLDPCTRTLSALTSPARDPKPRTDDVTPYNVTPYDGTPHTHTLGPPATWTVHTHGAHFKLKNGVGHYLAIKGDQVCDGQGGRFCELSIQPHQGHFVIRSADNRSGVAFPDGGNYAKAATHVGHGGPAQFKLERA